MQINTNAHMDCVTIFVIVVVDHSNKLIKASNSTLWPAHDQHWTKKNQQLQHIFKTFHSICKYGKIYDMLFKTLDH